MLLRCPANNTHRPIPRGVVINLSFITPPQLFHLVLAQIEHVICASSGEIRHGNLRAGEEGPWITERGGQCVRGPVEDCAPAAPGYCGYVESLGLPDSAAGERRIALKVDGDAASSPIIAEMGERVRIRIGIGLCKWPAVSENKASICANED